MINDNGEAVSLPLLLAAVKQTVQSEAILLVADGLADGGVASAEQAFASVHLNENFGAIGLCSWQRVRRTP